MSTAKQLALKATATLQKASDSFFNELDLLRQKITDLQQEIEWTRNAPLPSSEAVKRIDDFIQYNQERFRPSDCLSTLLAPSGRMGDVESFKPTTSNDNDLAPMLAWLFPDAMKSALTETLNDIGFEAGLPLSERGERVSKLEGKLLSLETEEESLIVSAESLGLPVYRRSDASPEIVLGLPGDEPKPPKPARRVVNTTASGRMISTAMLIASKSSRSEGLKTCRRMRSAAIRSNELSRRAGLPHFPSIGALPAMVSRHSRRANSSHTAQGCAIFPGVPGL